MKVVMPSVLVLAVLGTQVLGTSHSPNGYASSVQPGTYHHCLGGNPVRDTNGKCVLNYGLQLSDGDTIQMPGCAEARCYRNEKGDMCIWSAKCAEMHGANWRSEVVDETKPYPECCRQFFEGIDRRP